MASVYRSEDLENTHRLFLDGKSCAEIGKMLGVYPATVNRRLHHLGVFEDRRAKTGEFSDWRRRHNVDESFFENIDSEAKAYILGFLAADGNVSRNGRVLQIALAAVDKSHLERILFLMSSTHPLTHRATPDSWSVGIGSKRLGASLISLGVVPCKSLILTATPFDKTPDSLKHHFLRGYFDGDGYIRLNWKGKIGYTRSGSVFEVVGTEEFLSGTFNKVFPEFCSYYKPVSSGNTCVWRSASRSGISSIMDVLYKDATIFLSRKRSVYDQYLRECAHVKPRELSGNPNGNAEGNQQPSISYETAGSETIEAT